MTRKEAERLAKQSSVLQSLGFTAEEAEQLRRISMTLQRWHELECGTDHGCIGREENGKPFWQSSRSDDVQPIADRETGAKKRLAAILKARNSRIEQNPPDSWDDCGQCGGYHHPSFTGDCRDDANRWPSKETTKGLSTYIQTDPRGAALYIIRPGDVPPGEDVHAYYSRGICVY